MKNLEIGTKVVKIGTDYTGGRIGNVIEIQGERARVHWKTGPGVTGNGIRTWCKFSILNPQN